MVQIIYSDHYPEFSYCNEYASKPILENQLVREDCKGGCYVLMYNTFNSYLVNVKLCYLLQSSIV